MPVLLGAVAKARFDEKMLHRSLHRSPPWMKEEGETKKPEGRLDHSLEGRSRHLAIRPDGLIENIYTIAS
jgi:hypothetical protein